MHGVFVDAFVVYPSLDDPGWFVAHSLRTDQIGVDDSVEGAVCELVLALKALFEEHAKDPSVVVEDPAPDDVQALL